MDTLIKGLTKVIKKNPREIVQIQTYFLRGYDSGELKTDLPLGMQYTVGDQNGYLPVPTKAMLLSCLRKEDSFNVTLDDQQVTILNKVEGTDNVQIQINGESKLINGGCEVFIHYPNVSIQSNYDVIDTPENIPVDVDGNQMMWRNLTDETPVCRTTKRNCSGYGWWTSQYEFLSKEEAQNQFKPDESLSSVTIEGKTYTDFEWKINMNFNPESLSICDVTGCECGEGLYTCNNGDLFVSVEAVILLNKTGETMTVLNAVQRIPQTFKLQIFAKETNKNPQYLGYKNDHVGVRGVARGPVDNKFEGKTKNKDGVAYDVDTHYNITNYSLQQNNSTDCYIDLDTIGSYYEIPERGIYMFLVNIGGTEAVKNTLAVPNLRFHF